MIDTIFDQTTVRVLVELEHDDASRRARVRGEYQEMPGLSLTLPQAARLFNLERTECARVLDALVTEGALWTDGREFRTRTAAR